MFLRKNLFLTMLMAALIAAPISARFDSSRGMRFTQSVAKADERDMVLIGMGVPSAIVFGVWALGLIFAGSGSGMVVGTISQAESLRSLGLEDSDKVMINADGLTGKIQKKDGSTIEIFKNKDGIWGRVLAGAPRFNGSAVDEGTALKIVPSVPREIERARELTTSSAIAAG